MQRKLLGVLTALFFLGFFVPRIGAQTVTEGDLRSGSGRRRFDRAAEKQGRSDWLQDPYTTSGTQVRITFDARNADAILMTRLDFPRPQLLAEAQRIAQEMHLPQTDFITFAGSKTASVDMEFNDYLQRQKWQTDFRLDLAALAQALEKSALPRPIVLGIDPDSASSIRLVAPKQSTELSEIYFAQPKEIAAGTVAQFQVHFDWRAVPFLALLGFACVMAWIVPFQARKAAAKRVATPQEPQPELDPEAIQKQYDKSKPQWVQRLMMPLLILPVFLLMGSPRRAMSGMIFLLPGRMGMIALPALMFGGMAISWLLAKLLYRNVPKQPETEEQKAAKRMLLPIFPMMAMMVVLLVIMLLPVRTPEAAQWRKYIVFTLIPLTFLSSWGMSWWLARKNRDVLIGGVWYDMVQDMARLAGLKVKRVVLVKSAAPNAFATIFGTVGLTQGLTEKLEPDEVRAVIAHELGHLKKGHPRRNFALGIVMLVITIAFWNFVIVRVRPYVGEAGRMLLSTPILWMSVLNLPALMVVGRWSRKHEREADSLAVQWTGDPELVIRALTRIHTLNQSPHRLKQSDEVLHSHPSLENRIQAIRAGRFSAS